MILVDTSIWIDHLRVAEPRLVDLLEEQAVLAHPLVVGELAMGSLRNRSEVIDALSGIPSSVVASHAEVFAFIETRELYGRGLSLVDAHLLASVLLTTGALLWTRDKRLAVVAASLGRSFEH